MNPTTRSTLAKLRFALTALVLLGFVPGCYERVQQGNETTYKFLWWIGPLVILVGAVGIPGGWLVRKRSAKWGAVTMVLSVAGLAIVAPAMFGDRVVVDDEHFEATYGFWFAPTKHHVRFDDLSGIDYVEVAGNRGRTNYELRCRNKTGQVTVVHAGDLVLNTVPEVLERARRKGVHVQDLTD